MKQLLYSGRGTALLLLVVSMPVKLSSKGRFQRKGDSSRALDILRVEEPIVLPGFENGTLVSAFISELADKFDPPEWRYIAEVADSKFEPPDIVEWAQNNFIDSVTGKLIRLQKHQARILRAVMAMVWEHKVTTVVYSDIKKSGKTTIAGLIGAYWAANIESPNEIISVANDREQAQGRIYAALVPTMRRLGWDVPKANPSMTNRTTNSVIKAIGTNYAGEAGGNYGLTLWSELWAYKCLSADTEVFTDSGWKILPQLSLKDRFATINKNGELEYQLASKINVYHHAGKMINLDHRRADLLVTPNHRVLTRAWSGGKGKKEARSKHHSVIVANKIHDYREGDVITQASWNGKEQKEFLLPSVTVGSVTFPERKLSMDAWLILLGQFLAEGSVGYYEWKETRYPVCTALAQRSDNVIEHNSKKFRKLAQRALNKLGLAYKVKKQGIRIGDRQVAAYLSQLGQATEKFVPSEYKNLSDRQLRLMLNGYLLGDGENIGREGWRASTVSKRLYDDLFEIGLKVGYTVRGFDQTSINSVGNPVYRISFTTTQPVWQREQWHEVDYDGVVFCPTTPNGTIYVRRNGKSCWTGNSEDRKRLWEEMTQVPTRRYSIRWVETYAGFKGQSELLWKLYCTAFKNGNESKPLGEKIKGLEDLPIWFIPEAETVVYWNHVPRMPWQTPRYYKAQRKELRPNAYKRLHQNEWVSGEDVFILPEQWDVLEKCKTLNMQGDVRPIVLAADAGIYSDSAALVASAWDAQREGADLVMTRMWLPAKLEGFERPQIDLKETIGKQIEDMLNSGNFAILAIYYDPWQLHSIMVEMKKKFDRNDAKKLFVEFPQTNARIISDQYMYQSITSKNLKHDGDPTLREHVLNAVVDETTRGFRLDKALNVNKIDCAVAGSMAAYGASVRNKAKRGFLKA